MRPSPDNPERSRDPAAMLPRRRRASRFLASATLIIMAPFLLLLLIAGLLAMDDVGGPVLILLLLAAAFVTYKCVKALESTDGSGLGWILGGAALLILVVLAYAYGAMGFIGLWNNRLWNQ
jgi:hypothetical protein